MSEKGGWHNVRETSKMSGREGMKSKKEIGKKEKKS